MQGRYGWTPLHCVFNVVGNDEAPDRRETIKTMLDTILHRLDTHPGDFV